MPSLSRSKLYDLVWSKPMTKVAAEFDVTGTALKKTCIRHKVPTPERGYWAKLAHSKKVKQVPLPALDDHRLETIRIGQRYNAQFTEPVRKALAEARERASGRRDGASSFVPPEASPSLVSEPAVLAATRRAMSKARVDSEGFAEGGDRGVVGFRIGPTSIDRALQILSHLLAAGQALGYAPQATENGFALVVDGESIAFSITEQPRKTPHTPTPKELQQKADNERWGYGSSAPWPKYDHSPSGRLAVVIAGNEYSGLRRTFCERETRKFESILPDVLVGMAEHAAYSRERRRAAEEQQKAWREEETRRNREAAYVKREERREKFVDAIARQLKRRDRLVRVLNHLTDGPNVREDHPKGLADWLRRHLRQIDARLSPDFLDLSARSAKIDFDRSGAAESDEANAYSFRPSEIELNLWEIDEAEGVGRIRSQREWEELMAHDGATNDEAEHATLPRPR